MEMLLVKYAKEINQFKQDMECKYNSVDIGLNIKSVYTGLGEILEITTKYGDKMSIFDENETPISYHFNDISLDETKTYFVDVVTECVEVFRIDIHHNVKGYYVKNPQYMAGQTDYFETVIELINAFKNEDYEVFEYGTYVEDVSEEKSYQFNLKSKGDK